ncbi:acyltransferase [Butyrivibrio fibrisolvens]|uniref:acyltransferase n=1 Tax=Butyrivibrio fibrisolvens TaxID=831 RepID=UPI0003FA9515|nr:acyltransferase [Butyrivibrio fibrisolvens]
MKKLLQLLECGMLLIIITAVVLGKLYSKGEQNRIVITANQSNNELAQGNDIVVSGVEVNGIRVKASDFFDDSSWIVRPDGSLYWKVWEQPEGMKKSISGNMQNGNKYRLVLNASKWHGICTVTYGNISVECDEYKDVNSEDFYLDIESVTERSNYVYRDLIKFSKVLFATAIILFLIIFVSDSIGEKKGVDGNRKLYIDMMKNFAAFNVVLLHCTVSFFDNSKVGEAGWGSAVLVNCVTTFAVPLFFMISGALLIDKDISYKTVILKRLPGIYLPLLFWNAVYIIYRIYCGENIGFINSFLRGLYTNQYYHLWFMYTLIGIYVLLPILGNMYTLMTSNGKESLYYIFVLLILPLLINTFFSYMRIQGPSLWFALGAPEFALLIGGKLIDQGMLSNIYIKMNLEKPKETILYAIGVAVALLLTIVSTNMMSTEGPNKTFFGYALLPVFLFSFCIFGFFKSIESRLLHAHKTFLVVVQKLSDVSMGIYFIHMLIYGIMKTIYPFLFMDMLHAIGMAALVYVISALICYAGANFPGYLGRCFGRK